MALETTHVNENIRYEPDEQPPYLVAAGVGFQAAAVVLAPVVLGTVIIVRAAGQAESYLLWTVFAALVISGVSTVLQAVRIGRIGAGHVLVMGTSGAFIAVCITALAKGGPALMASLIVVSSLFQFALAARLSLLRRIITRVVSGTVIMLIAVTVMPIIFGLLTDVPEGTPPAAAPVAAGATLAALVVLALRAPAAWRLWAPLIGIAVGCAVAALFGLYDMSSVIEAPWIGLPGNAWPGLDLTLGAEFWALLPAFVVVTLVGAIETIGDGVAIQRVSRRRPRATDFRLVQGALNADGVGNLLSGLVGTPPNTTYSTSISLAELTGVAARRVGVYIGIVFVVLAFSPKVTALLIAHSQPRGSGLCHPAHRPALRAGHEAGRRGRPRSPEGRGGGAVVLDRRGLSESGGLRGSIGRDVGNVARQRHDRRRSCGDCADRVHGDDGSAAAAPGGRAGRRRAARNRGVPTRLCRKARMERPGGRAVVRRGGGDAVDPAPTG